MNTTENNKLIAEFMGIVFYDDENKYYDSKEGLFIGKKLRYHSDWNWLMSVVEKIEKEGFKSSIENFWCGFDGHTEETDGIWFESKGANLTKIQAVYEACVEFIKWYNQDK